MRVVHPLVQHGLLHLLNKALLNIIIGKGVCSHVEQKEVLFLCCQDALLYEILGQALSNVTQLIVKLQGVPCLACKRQALSAPDIN